MYFRCEACHRRRWRRRLAAALLGVVISSAAALTSGAAEDGRVLRVAADPNNLPFSNEQGEGFENKIAELVAHELGARLEYVWWAQRRGFFRNTLKEGRADVVIGVPAGFEMALTTRPYYRSTYVFVSRRDSPLQVNSFDDLALRRVRVGVQMIGDDFSNTPPAHALSARGIVANVRGYTVYGDYTEPNPPAKIIAAVATGEIEVAVAWGPLAGYFASREAVPLTITPVPPAPAGSPLRFTYAIAMGVRRGNAALARELDAVIVRRRAEIDRILDDYGVPRANAEPGKETENHERAD